MRKHLLILMLSVSLGLYSQIVPEKMINNVIKTNWCTKLSKIESSNGFNVDYIFEDNSAFVINKIGKDFWIKSNGVQYKINTPFTWFDSPFVDFKAFQGDTYVDGYKVSIIVNYKFVGRNINLPNGKSEYIDYEVVIFLGDGTYFNCFSTFKWVRNSNTLIDFTKGYIRIS